MPTVPDPGSFQPLDPGPLTDGELSVDLLRCQPGELVKGWVPSYEFAMRLPGEMHPVGHLNFRVGHTRPLEMYSGHVGYRVNEAHRGQHLAERSVRLLLPFFRAHGFTTLWITCNPDNIASRRTCERLGATMMEIVPVPPEHELFWRGEKEKCRYRLDL